MREDAWDMVEKALGGLRKGVGEATKVMAWEDTGVKIAACEVVVEQFNEFQIALDRAIWESRQ